MHCPNCQSEDLYLCSTAYDQGTTVTLRELDGSGMAIGLSGTTAHGTVQGSEESEHRTAFARKAAPPIAPTAGGGPG